MPTTPAAATRISLAAPLPGAAPHTTDDADAQAVVKQLDDETRPEGVALSDPKLIPYTVTPCPAVAAALSSAMKLTAGAGNQRKETLVEATSPNTLHWIYRCHLFIRRSS